MRDRPADDGRSGRSTARGLNPADPFIVRQGTGPRPIDVTTEQRQALRMVREASGRLPRRALRTDMLASLLRARMVTVYAELIELTVLGALVVTTPVEVASSAAVEVASSSNQLP
jgi:hypothetical protein